MDRASGATAGHAHSHQTSQGCAGEIRLVRASYSLQTIVFIDKTSAAESFWTTNSLGNDGSQSTNVEHHSDLGLHFHRLPIHQVWFIFPRFHCIICGTLQSFGAA